MSKAKAPVKKKIKCLFCDERGRSDCNCIRPVKDEATLEYRRTSEINRQYLLKKADEKIAERKATETASKPKKPSKAR